MLRHPVLKISLIGGLLALAIALSCHDSVTLPPVQGPPLAVPERRAGHLADRPLEVIHASPKGELSAAHAQLTVSFSKPMVALGKVEDRARTAPLTIKPDIPGVQRWLGSRTLVFIPDEPLPGSTTFTASVPAGLRSLDGTELAKGTTWSFTTPRLAVSRMFPAPGARWVTPDTRVTLYFNQPVRPSVVARHVSFQVRPGAGEPFSLTARVKQGKNPKQMVLHPTTAFPKDAKIAVQLAAQMTGLEGPLPMGTAYSGTFQTYGPLRVIGLSCEKDCDPDYSVSVRFSNPVPQKQARGAIRVNNRPLRAGSSTYPTTTVYLDSRFRARARYTVAVSPDLRDRFGQQLEPARQKLAFTTGDYEPSVYFPLETGVLEAAGPKKLPVVFRNAKQARLASKRLSPAELVALLGDEDYWDRDARLVAKLPGARRQELQVAGRPNARVTRRIDLAALAGKGARGILAVELETLLGPRRGERQSEQRVERAIVRISDLALTAKYSPHASLVWVTSLATGQPVTGCEVAIWQPGGKAPLWEGTTDASGLALAPGALELQPSGGDAEQRRYVFFARKGADESYVLSSTQSGISPWDFGIDETWEDRAASLIGMIFTDRGIYRPGDTVHVKGILRRTGEKGLRTPRDTRLALTVTDSRGEKLQTAERRLSEFGSFDLRVELPAGAPLGSYNLVGKAAEGGTVYGSFRVEEYRPAEFKVEVRPERKAYIRGDTLRWSASGAYLFGAPMRGAKVTWYLHQSSAHFQPPGHDGFVFSDEVRWWQDDESTGHVPLVARGSDKLDQRGEIAKTLVLQPPKMTGPMSYEIETTVTDVSRQSISSRSSVLLHPGEFYVGARPKETFLRAGESLEAEVVAATPAGKRLSGKALRGTLYRRTWHSVRKQGMGGSHYFVTRPQDTAVGTCAVTSAAKPKPCRIPVAKAGYYILRLQATDRRKNPVSSAFGIYVTGADYVAWRRDAESRVKLVTNRKRYKVGQVARVMIQSPFADAHGLFTVERSGILVRRAFKLKGTSTWMEVPITRDLVPNAYVSVLLVRGRVAAPKKVKAEEDDPGQPAFKVGYAKLAISQAGRELGVTVRPERGEVRPGEEVSVDLAVKDAKGKPVRAELTVFVADEGVLSLIGYRTPDPMAIFYAERGLSVRTADNRIRLLSRRIFGEKGNNPGGGGGEMGEGPGGVRRTFVSTPYFNPAVITDANGRARVTFKLPDNLTTFRVMAVATSREAEFGSAQGQIKVNKPLLMLPTLPRLVRVGDRIAAGVVVHNHSGGSGQVRVTAAAEGIQLEGAAMQAVTVRNGGSAEARFTFSAKSPGEAVFRFTAQLEDHKDGLELRRPVKLAVVKETVAANGSTTSAVAEGIVPSKGVRTDVGGLEIAMSSSALVGLKDGVEYLMDYPFECLEQTTSRMVPLVLLKDLTKAYKLGTPAELDALVARLIAKVETQQRWNGGFTYWPASPDARPWISAYASWGLSQAKRHGFRVSKRALERAKGYLKEQLRRPFPKDRDDAKIDLDTRAFLVHVLAELDEPVDAHLSTLYERRKELAFFARALLLSTVAGAKHKGKQTMIDNLTEELLNQVHQTANAAKVEENLGDGYAPLFHSNTRSTAMVLRALLQTRPEHPLVEKLVRTLLEARREGRWRNTQETVYALLALDTYYRVREADVPDFVARVVLGDATLVKQRFEGRSLAVRKHEVPMKRLAAFSGPLGFLKQGTGRLYYNARLRYARSELPREPWDEGFYVTRTYERVPEGTTNLAGDSGKAGAGTRKVKAGDLVRVTLRLIVPQQMHFVAVDDPLPAGLEAINFRLMTAASSLRRSGDFFGFQPRHSHRRHSSTWYTPFYQQQIRDDRVQLFADAVPPGVHTYVYLARATTIGAFVAPPTHVEQMYEPEVFGRTGASLFEVTPK